MGDVLMNLPAVRLLRQTFPKAWITLLVDEKVADLFRNHPDIDEVMTVNAPALERSFAARRALRKKIKAAAFDLALVANPQKNLHLMMFLARIPYRIGYDRKWGFLLNKRLPVSDNAGRHEIDRNLHLASLASDKTWDGALSLPVDERAMAGIRERLAVELKDDRPVIAIHPGTSLAAKRWAPDRFAALGNRIEEAMGANVVLIGGVEERPASEAVSSGMKRKPVDWTGRLTLKELVAFFHHPRVRLLVSADSGPVHVAWISGTPVVALYAKGAPGCEPARWGPRDGVSRTIFKPIGDISADEVAAAAGELLSRGKGKA